MLLHNVVLPSSHDPLSMNRKVETCLVFPRLTAGVVGVGLPAFSGHPVKKLVNINLRLQSHCTLFTYPF